MKQDKILGYVGAIEMILFYPLETNKRAFDAEQRASNAEQRAQLLAEKLRELGSIPNSII